MRVFVGFNPPDEIGHGSGVDKHQNEVEPAKLPDKMVKFSGNERAGDNHHEPFGPIFIQNDADAFHEKNGRIGKRDKGEEIEFLSIHSGNFAEQHLDIAIVQINVPSLDQMPQLRRKVFADEVEGTNADGEQNQAVKDFARTNQPENLVMLAMFFPRWL